MTVIVSKPRAVVSCPMSEGQSLRPQKRNDAFFIFVKLLKISGFVYFS
jgi:hypothetical protein